MLCNLCCLVVPAQKLADVHLHQFIAPEVQDVRDLGAETSECTGRYPCKKTSYMS